jgi:hypothetical protein
MRPGSRRCLEECSMQIQFASRSLPVDRPRWVWLAVLLEVLTGLLAIPVGLSFIADPSGLAVGVPQGWIEATPFGSYLIPGLYLLLVNGFGMLLLAALTVMRHWLAPWLTGAVGVGMIVWILVQVAVLPQTMILTWVFLAIGFVLGFIALFWLRRTDQLRVW